MTAVSAGPIEQHEVCAACGRAWVDGETTCPFCATTRGAVERCSRCQRAWVDGEARCPFCGAVPFPGWAGRADFAGPVIGMGTAQGPQLVVEPLPPPLEATMPPPPDLPTGIRALAIGQVVAGGTGLLLAVLLAALSTMLSLRITLALQSVWGGEEAWVRPVPVMGILLIGSGLLIIGGALDMVLAWGLWELRPWARRVAMILAVPALTLFPVGTAIGLWILIYLSGPHIRRMFSAAR